MNEKMIPGMCSVGNRLYGLFATNLSPGQARAEVIRENQRGGENLVIYTQGSTPRPWWAWPCSTTEGT